MNPSAKCIPLLSIKAGPRDGDQWIARLKQELNALIKVVFLCEAWSVLCMYVLLCVLCATMRVDIGHPASSPVPIYTLTDCVFACDTLDRSTSNITRKPTMTGSS